MDRAAIVVEDNGFQGSRAEVLRPASRKASATLPSDAVPSYCHDPKSRLPRRRIRPGAGG